MGKTRNVLLGAGLLLALVVIVPALAEDVGTQNAMGTTGQTSDQKQFDQGQFDQKQFDSRQFDQKQFDQRQNGQGGFFNGQQDKGPKPTRLQPGCEPNGHTEWQNPGDPNDTRTICASNNSAPQTQGDWRNAPQGGQNFNDGGMNEQDSARQAKDLEREKKRFSKDMGQVQTVKMIRGLIKKLPAGYSASQDVYDALAKVDAINSAAQAAADMDTLNDKRQELMDVMDTLREAEQNLRQIGDIARMEKQATKELAKLTKKLAKSEANLAKSGIDGGDLVVAAHTAVDGAAASLQKAVSVAKNGNVEDAQSEFENFFDTLGETWQTVGVLDAVNGITKGTAGIEKNIAAAKKMIQGLAKKADVSELLDGLQEASDKVAELKSMIKSRDFSPEDAFQIFMDLNDLRQQLENGLPELGVGGDINFFPMEMGKMPSFGQGGGPNFGQGGPGGPGGPGGSGFGGGPGFGQGGPGGGFGGPGGF